MAGVSAAKLAQAGFTGAPALIVEEVPEFWQDLGERWYMLEQYYKPYPVCRWAQAPIEAALDLHRTHGFTHHNVTGLEIETFHEAIRLATSAPDTTEKAQYSTSFPVDGTPAGRVTSGAFGASVGKSLALGFVKAGIASPGDDVDICSVGRAHRARVLAEPAFDRGGARLRA